VSIAVYLLLQDADTPQKYQFLAILASPWCGFSVFISMSDVQRLQVLMTMVLAR
jgi:hypothetical protein